MTPPNPLLAKLGLPPEARAVIFHADDIGMCHASLAAYQDLVAAAAISSAAVMVPCPWYVATATYCREHQERLPQLDMGVHLTLTSEWGGYRWGPVSTRDAASRMVDADGLFFQDCEPVQENGQETAVIAELRRQIERALAAGIDVTHIDSHMGCLFHPRLLPAYLQMAREFQVPALMMRATALQETEDEFVDSEMLAQFQQMLIDLERQGFPLLDKIEMMSLDPPQDRLAEGRRRLQGLPPGVSYFIIHPSIDSPELRAIAPDWRCRVADYELFMSGAWRQEVASSGIHVIGWRELRNVMRQL